MKRLLALLTLSLVGWSAYAQLIAPDASKYKVSVAPMLTTRWSQSSPFNGMCPKGVDSKGDSVRCPVGCVALALAQIMKYYDYPLTGQGSKTYKPLLSKTELSADFGATTYDWTHMKDSYLSFGSYRNYSADDSIAVATLCYQIGVSVGMMYSPSGSSAFAYGNITHDLVDNFRYSSDSIRYLLRSDYTKAEWMDLIFNELSAGRPIFYAGNSPTQGGHAWVLDGYDAEGKVHINWGWRGSGNDYYDIDLTDSSNDFYNNQSMIIGIKPPITNGINRVTTDDKAHVRIYGPDGRMRNNLQKGINLIRLEDGTVKKVILK
jgi:hypothetical protein